MRICWGKEKLPCFEQRSLKKKLCVRDSFVHNDRAAENAVLRAEEAVAAVLICCGRDGLDAYAAHLPGHFVKVHARRTGVFTADDKALCFVADIHADEGRGAAALLRAVERVFQHVGDNRHQIGCGSGKISLGCGADFHVYAALVSFLAVHTQDVVHGFVFAETPGGNAVDALSLAPEIVHELVPVHDMDLAQL